MARAAGFIIDVPITLSVAVRGKTEAEAKKIAREFAECLQPTEFYAIGYCEGAQLPEGTITEISLESSMEEQCEVLDELEAEE